MNEDLKRFFEPWELCILEIVEKVENSDNIVKEVADEDSNSDDSKTNKSISVL